MNSQQSAFVRAVAEGQSQVEAYVTAFPKASRSSARSAAARLMKNPDVIADVSRLRAEADKAAVMSIQEKREWLAGVVRGRAIDAPKVADQLRAVEVDSRLAGDNYVDRPQGLTNPWAFIIALADRIDKGPPSEKNITPVAGTIGG